MSTGSAAEERHGQDAIWDWFQNEGRSSFAGSRARLGHLVARLRRAPGRPARVLNVGVGDGGFEELAAAAGFEVYALDPNERALRAVAARLELGDRARVGGFDALPFEDGSLDAVVASEVLEHLPDAVLAAALAETRRVLRPGGRLVGTVPAREPLERETAVCPGCGARFHRWGHVRSFDRAALAALLGRELRVERIDERPFPNWPTLNFKGRLAGLLKLALARIGVHGDAESFVFEAVRDPAGAPGGGAP